MLANESHEKNCRDSRSIVLVGCLLDPLEVPFKRAPEVDMASQCIDLSALDQNLNGP